MNVDRHQLRVLQGTFQTHRIGMALGSGSEVEMGNDDVKQNIGGDCWRKDAIDVNPLGGTGCSCSRVGGRGRLGRF
jgi:hypothetical protein